MSASSSFYMLGRRRKERSFKYKMRLIINYYTPTADNAASKARRHFDFGEKSPLLTTDRLQVVKAIAQNSVAFRGSKLCENVFEILANNKHFLQQENVQQGVCKSEENLENLVSRLKLDYIPNILPQTRCPAKFAFRLQRGSKLAKSAIFCIFFGFSNITTELFILQ